MREREWLNEFFRCFSVYSLYLQKQSWGRLMRAFLSRRMCIILYFWQWAVRMMGVMLWEKRVSFLSQAQKSSFRSFCFSGLSVRRWFCVKVGWLRIVFIMRIQFLLMVSSSAFFIRVRFFFLSSSFVIFRCLLSIVSCSAFCFMQFIQLKLRVLDFFSIFLIIGMLLYSVEFKKRFFLGVRLVFFSLNMQAGFRMVWRRFFFLVSCVGVVCF